MIQYYCKQNKNEKSLTHGKWYAYPKAMSHTIDSVMIDRYTTTETKGDTVFVDRLTTEYRYRLSTDTIYRSYTDTVYTTAPLPPEKTPPTNLKYLLVVPCLILFFPFLFRLIWSKS